MCASSVFSGRVEQAIAHQFPVLSPTLTLADAIAHLQTYRQQQGEDGVDCAVVMDGAQWIGLVRDRDIVAALGRGQPLDAPVQDWMETAMVVFPWAAIADDPCLIPHLHQQLGQDLLIESAGTLVGILPAARLGALLLDCSTEYSRRRDLEVQVLRDRLQFVLGASPAMIFACHPEDSYDATFVSDNSRELLGYSPQQIITTPNFWVEHIHPEDRDRVLADLSPLFSTGTHQLSYRFLRQDGSYGWLGSGLRLVRDGMGDPVEIIGYVIDITAQKQAELALMAQAAHLSAAQRIANLGSWEFDVATQTITWSPQSFVVFGFDPAEGEPTLESLEACFSPGAREYHRQVLENAIAHRCSYELEIEFTRADGQMRWVAARGEPLWDEAEQRLRFVGTVLDVTHRKIAELERQRSEDLYRAVVEDQMDLICRFLPDGTLTFANRAYCEYFDLDLERAVGQLVQTFIPEDQYVPLFDLLKTLTPESPTTTNEQRTVASDGTDRWQLWTDRAIYDAHGTVVEYQSVGRDITERKQMELALKQSEDRYRAIVEDQTEMICRFRPDGSLSFANTAYRRYFDVDTGTADENAIWQYVPQDELQFVRTKVLGLTPEAPTVTYEHRVCLPDGTTAWQLWTDRAIFDDQGQLLEYQSAGRDITDRKQAELALQESEAKLQLFIKYAPVAVAMVDTQMCYLAVSDRWRQDYGLGDGPVLGQSHLHRVRHRSPYWETIYQRCLAGAVDVCEEDRILRDDGRLDWVRWEVRPWHRPNGSIGGLILLTEVITERKQAEQQLRQLSDRLALAVKSGGIGIWEWDMTTHQVVWDAQMYRLYGRPLDQPLADLNEWRQHLIHPEDYPAVADLLEVAVRTGQEFDTSFRIRWPDGSLRVLKAFGQVQYAKDGCPIRMVGINFDMTKLEAAKERIQLQNEQLSRANQELERATRLKDEFLANMSHELRTPLNAILGLSEGLQEDVFGALTPRQLRAIATIERSGQHLLELINDILDLSKIESGRLELQPDEVQVDAICRTSLSFVQEAAIRKHINLDYYNQGVMLLSADARRLRQILMNLLANAVKFTPEGGDVTLTVAPCSAAQAQALAAKSDLSNVSDSLDQASLSTCSGVLFAVKDTGIGIAAADRPKLFQPFVQIDSALNRQHEGTGLGLSLVQRLTQLHGGQAWVDSIVGGGSCFSVWIPTAIAPSDGMTQPAASASFAGDVPYVLIVEDSTDAAEQMERYIAELGLETRVFNQGEAAIAHARIHPPALILLDLLLPEASGWDILSQIRGEAAIAPTPVIITSVMDEPQKNAALEVAGYLVKPFSRSELRSAIHRIYPELVPMSSLEPLGTENRQNTGSHQRSGSPIILVIDEQQSSVDAISDYLTLKGYRLVHALSMPSALDLAQTHTPALVIMDSRVSAADPASWISTLRSVLSPTLPIIVMATAEYASDRDRYLSAGADEFLLKPIRLKLLLETIQQLLNPL
jgi:PAS domain S-box-containing protein